MKILRFAAILLISLGNLLYAQNELDALRYSQSTSTGTARALGLAGAASTLGSDLSAMSLNPAGLGFYNRSDVVITPGFRVISSDASYIGEAGTGSESNFGLANLGAAFSIPMGESEEKGVKSFTIAAGYNQVENFYRESNASAFNNYNSITDFFVQDAQGINSANLGLNSYGGLGFFVYAIDTLQGQASSYFPAVNDGRIQQSIRLAQEGRINEWTISGAANFDDFLYVGLSIGIQSLRYEQNLTIEEEDTQNLHEFYQNSSLANTEFPFDALEFNDNFSTSGRGINAKLGLIVRPVDALRLGLSLNSPTYLVLTDEYRSELSHTFSTVDGLNTLEQSTDAARYDYNLVTPYKVTIGGTYIIKKRALISADVDLVGYPTAQLGSEYVTSDPAYYSFVDENQRISELFQTAVNYRLGAELRFGVFYLRGGAAFFGNPLKDELSQYQDHEDLNATNEFNIGKRVLSFGLGMRQKSFYLDATFVNQQNEDAVNPYNLQNAVYIPTLVSTQKSNSVVISLGVRF